MTIMMIGAGFVVGGVVLGLFATATAPIGYEDDSGFHFGSEDGQVLPTRVPDSASKLPEAARLTPQPA